MKKLLQGIIEFRQKVLPDYRETFTKLASGQTPDSLFIACSDSRVVPNLFASTNPGDLFVVRNVGNLIPPCDSNGVSTADESEAAAIEFAVQTLQVRDIILCGHSECGAIQALIQGREHVTTPNLRAWLRHAERSLPKKGDNLLVEGPKEHHNFVSQLNVLQQIAHLKTYPSVQARTKEGKLRLHGWWFELSTANVYAYEDRLKRFVLIDEVEAERILKALTT
ncbi:MAG: carbonic anhydrase [Pseudomonadota bacterium]